MSSNLPAIRVENLGKRYLIPKKHRPGSLGAHLKDFVPFFRDKTEDYFWALKDVSFEVQPGEILGILGKNGSGKSTLLKILSNVTFPTEGRAELSGRVGSLLEVGTGFHPDLTGRENVFMAGSLLGLPQSEIRQKFDEIVDFSGIGQFIDVPVKRYSSGMYVRLAFSVASLLQSEILILDEVMAVGDLAFREKSQKNIQRIADDGKTIIFVSHNIQAIRNVCTTGLLMVDGKVTQQGTAEKMAEAYMKLLHGISQFDDDIPSRSPRVSLENAKGWDDQRVNSVLKWVETCDARGNPSRVFDTGATVRIRIGFNSNQEPDSSYFTVFFIDEFGDRVQVAYSLHDPLRVTILQKGVIECTIEDLRLVDGTYSLTLDYGQLIDGQMHSVDCVPDATQIRVRLGDYLGPVGLRPNQGSFAHQSKWHMLDH